MNPSTPSPKYNLTSYALGEVQPEEIPTYEAHLQMDPSAKAEYDRILETVKVLQQYPAPTTRRLHPQQLKNVLKGPALPRKDLKPATILPFYQRPAFKVAIAASFTLGAFLLGHLTSNQLHKKSNTVKVQQEEKFEPTEEEPHHFITSSEDSSEASKVAPTLSDFQHILVESLEPKVTPQLDTYRRVQAELAAYKAPQPATPEAQVSRTPLLDIIAKIPSNSDPISLRGFRNTNQSSEDIFTLVPQYLRQKNNAKTGQNFASIQKAPEVNFTPRKTPEQVQPPLQIKSWKAEIASCPWDPARRLLRVVIQAPANQVGILFNDSAYQFNIKFDTFQVLGFRPVAEKHIAPENKQQNATRIMWYELIPSRNFSASDTNPLKIGQLTLHQPKSATETSTQTLPLLDQGTNWRNAREDFIFETSMVGLGLLLQGYANTSFLDHSVVREIAENYKGKDEDGSRAKFIELIRSAQQAGGVSF